MLFSPSEQFSFALINLDFFLSGKLFGRSAADSQALFLQKKKGEKEFHLVIFGYINI